MKRLLMLPCLLALCTALHAVEPQEKVVKIARRAMTQSLEQSMLMYNSVAHHPELIPRTAKNDSLITCRSSWWTSGFFPGTLWYLYEYSRNEQVLQAAEQMTARVSREQFTTSNHDIGFQINCSAGNGYRLTGKEEYRQALINAGKALATRFDSTVGCTRSWDSKRWNYAVIIDNMMNLELFGVSSSLTGNNDHYHMAKAHADKSMVNHFREDGSSYHLVDYNPKTGQVVSQMTHQGVSDSSAWSRGQAWGLYGYTMMYRQTSDERYLKHAIKIGQFIMNHPRLPKDKIPYWDFDAPNIPKADRDASAGAIMAAAFIELSGYVDGELSQKFFKLGEKQIESLSSPSYFAKKGTNANFILRHSTGFTAKQYEIDAPLTYADYYYVEALSRYLRLSEGKSVVDVRTAYSTNSDRAEWISAMERIARPVLVNMSRGELKKNMPVESTDPIITRRQAVTHLEAIGRLLTGIAPWLELGPDSTPEGKLRQEYAQMAIKSIQNCVDPLSPDYLNFNKDRQPLVDAAFLAHGLLRAPTQLWAKLDKTTQQRLIEEFKSSRVIVPGQNNWLLFSAMVEAALMEFSQQWDYQRIEYALQQHEQWYKGDGWYGDGPEMHLDYYNSYVIQPMMMQVLEVAKRHNMPQATMLEVQQKRYARYAEQQERLISPEGTFPLIGRSLAYRFGAFHALSDVALRGMLPKTLTPAQVRSALTAVIERQVNAPDTFDKNGWLRVGFAGHQPSIGETYISTGSLYLCSAVFVALGLPETDPFWSGPNTDWTARKAWNGVNLKCDKALKNN